MIDNSTKLQDSTQPPLLQNGCYTQPFSEDEIKVPDFENEYIVSRNGYVKNVNTGRILKPTKKEQFTVNLRSGKKHKQYSLNRLVYSLFNNVKLQRNHLVIPKDGNPLNCNLDNLKLITKRNFVAAKMSNKTGLTGVYKMDEYQYSTRICFEGVEVNLHSSVDMIECHKIYQLAKTILEEYDRKKTEILSNMAKNRLINKSVNSGVF
jgi:predicted DNA-binding helix-hairpin-helix protein